MPEGDGLEAAVDTSRAGDATVDDHEEPTAAARRDLTSVPLASDEAAASVVELAAGPGSKHMDPGPWFATTFSQSLVFDLPESGRLVDLAQGSIVIEVGTPGNADHGLLRIVEAVAFASPDGPVPISTIDADTEFSNTTVLGRGVADAADRELSWRDVVVESELVPAMFHRTCALGSVELVCTGGPVSEAGEVGVELDVPVRFVGQPLGSRRLYVVATAIGLETSVGNLEPSVFAHALEVAASLTTTTRLDTTTRQLITTLGPRADSIPEGEWVIDLGGVEMVLELDTVVAGPRLSVAESTYVAFEVDGDDGAPPSFFGVQVFQGFVDGALEGADLAESSPLPTEVYLRGVDTVAGIERSGEGSIAGYDTVWYETGARDLTDSPFVCRADQRPRDLAPELGCVVYSVDGWMFVDDEPGGVRYQSHYIEELGVVVSFAGTDEGAGGLSPLEPFRQLLDALRLTPTTGG